jgi:phage shock protein E
MSRYCLALVLIVSMGSTAAAIEFTRENLDVVKKNVAEKKAVLVDVRSKYEWDKGHVDGAIFLPITTLEEIESNKLAKVLPKKKILYTHCAVGIRAEAAGEILEQQGYTVRVLKRGYKELIEAGFKKAKKKDEDSR